MHHVSTPLPSPSPPRQKLFYRPLAQISKWADPKRLLQLPSVAVLALHFVLVFLPVKLRAQNSICSQPTAAATAAVTDGKSFVGLTMVASSSAAGGLGTPGEKRAAGKGVSTGGVSGAGSVADGYAAVPSQLGDVPSHVFKVVLPSDPAFDVEVRCGSCYGSLLPRDYFCVTQDT